MADSEKEEASEVIFSLFNDVVVDVIGQQAGEKLELKRVPIQKVWERLENDSTEEVLLSSSITLSGEQFHCSFFFAALASTVRALIDVELDDPGDWLGELANRIAGKVKNSLSEYDVLCQLGLPTKDCIWRWKSETRDDLAYVVETRSGMFVAGLYVEVSSDLLWEHNPTKVTAQEGSILLF